MHEVLVAVGSSEIYYIMLVFLALFPITISGLAVNSSREFYLSRNLKNMRDLNPQKKDLMKAREVWKLISIVIPARNEEGNLRKTINAALNIDWPELEVIVVNDGSVDKTEEIINLYINDPRIVYIKNETNKGKAVSLNEGMKVAKSEIVLILDADAVPCSNVLNKMAPRLMLHENVAAVTGNPRVSSVPNLLTKLQAIEFTSTISTLRRGQTAWGIINTVSGITTLLKKKIVTNAGGFSDTQPTEDIELTWKLHRLGYRCVYEPDAQVGMVVPSSLSSWFKQRTRWSSGLVRVLQKHGKNILKEKKVANVATTTRSQFGNNMVPSFNSNNRIVGNRVTIRAAIFR
jgi:poly-beta-1,6-N-acetyl-D-glucosamine synthase